MTTDTDKLVELARASSEYHLSSGSVIMGRDELAAFRAAIIASLCGDVEPVAHMVAIDDGFGTVFIEFLKDRPPAGEKLYPASTVAALKARATDWQRLYDRAINEANGLTNYVEDRPELRSAERRLDVIYADARALKGQP